MATFELGKWYYGLKPIAGTFTSNGIIWAQEMDRLEGRPFQCSKTFYYGKHAFLSIPGHHGCALHIDWATGPFESKNAARIDYLRTKISIKKRVKPKVEIKTTNDHSLVMDDLIDAASREMTKEIEKEIIGTIVEDVPNNNKRWHPLEQDEDINIPIRRQSKTKTGASAALWVHSKLWREIMRDKINKNSGHVLAKQQGWKKPSSDERYIIPTRKGENRVEELPSGKTVFYVNVGTLPQDQVEIYLKKVKADLAGKKNDELQTLEAKAIKYDPTLAQELKSLENNYDARIKKIWSEHDERVAEKHEKRNRLNPPAPSKPKNKWRTAIGLTSIAAVAGSAAYLLPYLILLL
ncbi:MAG: hypothetical protein ACTSYO_08130 [Candidatus Ranarchaeia archaeon]